jgi:hypothetical protein
MTSIYTTAGITVGISKERLSLANVGEPFEGHDADGPWLDCYTYEGLK